jgi:hypothetical protein
MDDLFPIEAFKLHAEFKSEIKGKTKLITMSNFINKYYFQSLHPLIEKLNSVFDSKFQVDGPYITTEMSPDKYNQRMKLIRLEAWPLIVNYKAQTYIWITNLDKVLRSFRHKLAKARRKLEPLLISNINTDLKPILSKEGCHLDCGSLRREDQDYLLRYKIVNRRGCSVTLIKELFNLSNQPHNYLIGDDGSFVVFTIKV